MPNFKKIQLINPNNNKFLNYKNKSLVDDDNNEFKIENEIPRINSDKEYTKSFGYQWNKYAETQILKKNYTDGVDINSIRFFSETNWKKNNLKNINILEAGSGAGKFSKVILEESEANLYSFDSSTAIDVNKKNNYRFLDKRLFLCQANIEQIPYLDNTFDKVICLGVLQHTENFYISLKHLISKLRPGGEIIIDFYPINGFWTKISAKYILRPFLKRLPIIYLQSLIEFSATPLIYIYFFLSKCGLNFLTRFLPICDIKNTLPNNLTKKRLKEWVILDTLDMFSPKYDNPQKIKKVKEFMMRNNIEVSFAGMIKFKNMKAAVLRGIKN